MGFVVRASAKIQGEEAFLIYTERSRRSGFPRGVRRSAPKKLRIFCEEEKDMKKKLLSLLLAAVMVFSEVGPAFAMELDTLLGWRASQTVGEVTVSVKAPDGVFPKDATLKVTRVESDNADAAAIDVAVEDARDDALAVARKFVYDIKVLDAAGNELQPNLAFGKPTVTFTTAAAENEALSAEVYHIDETGGEMTAEALDVTTNKDKISAETDGFSYYVVELAYEKKTININNYNPIELYDVFYLLGFEDSAEAMAGNVTEWLSSDPEVADVDLCEFVNSYDSSTYDAYGLCFYGEGVAEVTLFVDEGGDEDTAYTFDVAVVLRDEQDVEGSEEHQSGVDYTYVDVDTPYSGSLTPADLGVSLMMEEMEQMEQMGGLGDVTIDCQGMPLNNYMGMFMDEHMEEIMAAYGSGGSIDPEILTTMLLLNTLMDGSSSGFYEIEGADYPYCLGYALELIWEAVLGYGEKGPFPAEELFPTWLGHDAQILPFMSVVPADADPLTFHHVPLSEDCLCMPTPDKRFGGIDEMFHCYLGATPIEEEYFWIPSGMPDELVSIYEDFLEEFQLDESHDVNNGMDDDVKLVMGYLIMADGECTYYAEETEPFHVTIENVGTGYEPGGDDEFYVYIDSYIYAPIGATKEELIDLIWNEIYYINDGSSSYENGKDSPYELHIAGNINTTDVSGLDKYEDDYPAGYDYEKDEYILLDVYGLYLPSLYLTDADGKVVWTYTKVDERIPYYSGYTYTVYLYDSTEIPELETDYYYGAYFVPGEDGYDEDGSRLDNNMVFVSDDASLIAKYNENKLQMTPNGPSGSAGVLGLTQNELVNYVADHVYLEGYSTSGELWEKADPSLVELNEDDSDTFPVDPEELEGMPFAELELCFDVYNEQGEYVDDFYLYAVYIAPVTMTMATIDTGDSGTYATVLAAYLPGMEEPMVQQTGALTATVGEQGSAASQLIAFLKNEYDWTKYFKEGEPREEFSTEIQIVYLDGLINPAMGSGSADMEDMMLAGTCFANTLSVSGVYGEDGKPVASSVKVKETHELPIKLNASYNPNAAGVYNIGITPVIGGKAQNDMAVTIPATVQPVRPKAVRFEDDAPEAISAYIMAYTAEDMEELLLGDVSALNENNVPVTPTMTITDGEGTELTVAELCEAVAAGEAGDVYTIIYKATHKKDPTVFTSTQPRTLTLKAAGVTFTGADDALTVDKDAASNLRFLMEAINEGVSAKDDTETSLEVTAALPESFTGAAGTYENAITYTAEHPYTGKTFTKTRTLVITEVPTGCTTTTLSIKDADKVDFNPADFVLGTADQSTFDIHVEWKFEGQPADRGTKQTVKVHIPYGFEVAAKEGTIAPGGIEKAEWSTEGSYDEPDGSVVTYEIASTAESVTDDLLVYVRLDELYPALKEGYNTYTFRAQNFRDGLPYGDNSGATVQLRCDDELLSSENVTIATTKQFFTPAELFGKQVAYHSTTNSNFRMGDLRPYVITVTKQPGVLPDPEWGLTFSLPAGFELLNHYNGSNTDYVWGAKLTIKDGDGEVLRYGIVEPKYNYATGEYALPLYTPDYFSFPENVNDMSYMDSVRAAATIQVELYFDSEAAWENDSLIVNIPTDPATTDENKLANVAAGKVAIYNGDETPAAESEAPISIVISNPSAGSELSNDVSELSMDTWLANYKSYNVVGNGTQEDYVTKLDEKMVQIVYPRLDEVTTQGSYDQNCVSNSWNIYQNIRTETEYPYELSPIGVCTCFVDSKAVKIDYVVSSIKSGVEPVTKTLKFSFNDYNPVYETLFEVNKDAGEYVSKVVCTWIGEYTTMANNWDNDIYLMDNDDIAGWQHHFISAYVPIILQPKAYDAEGNAITSETDPIELTGAVYAKGSNEALRETEQSVSYVVPDDRVRVFAEDDSYDTSVIGPDTWFYVYLRTYGKNTMLPEENVHFVVTGEAVKYMDWRAPYYCENVNNYEKARVVAYSVSPDATTGGYWTDPEGTWVTDEQQLLLAKMANFDGMALTGVVIDASEVIFSNFDSTDYINTYLYFCNKPLTANKDFLNELLEKVAAAREDGEDGYALSYDVGYHSDALTKTAYAVEWSDEQGCYVETQPSLSYTDTFVLPWEAKGLTNKQLEEDYVLDPLSGTAERYNIDEMELVRLMVDVDKGTGGDSFGFTRDLTYTFEPADDTPEGKALLNLTEGIAVKGDYNYGYSVDDPTVIYTVMTADGVEETRIAQSFDYWYTDENGYYGYPFIMEEGDKEDDATRFVPFDLDQGEYVTGITVKLLDNLADNAYMPSIGLVRINPLPEKTGAGFVLPTTAETACKLPGVKAELSYKDHTDAEIKVNATLESDAKVYFKDMTKEITGYTAQIDIAQGATKTAGGVDTYTLKNTVTYSASAERFGSATLVPAGYSAAGNQNKENKLGDPNCEKLRPTFYYELDKHFEYVGRPEEEAAEEAGVTFRYYPKAFANGNNLLVVTCDSYCPTEFNIPIQLMSDAEMNVTDGNNSYSPVVSAYMDVATDIDNALTERSYPLVIEEGKSAEFPADLTEKFGESHKGMVCGITTTFVYSQTLVDGFGMVATTVAADGSVVKNSRPETPIDGAADVNFGLFGQILYMSKSVSNYNVYVPIYKLGDTVKYKASVTAPTEDEYTQGFDSKLVDENSVQVDYDGSSEYTVLYTTKENVTFEGNTPTGYVTADDIEDWSAVTGVYIHVNELQIGEAFEFNITFDKIEKDLLGTQLGYEQAFYNYGELQSESNYNITPLTQFYLKDYPVTVSATEGLLNEPTAGVHVEITTSDGEPLPVNEGEKEISGEGETDEYGNVTLYVPAPGEYIAHLYKEGFNDLGDKGESSVFDPISGEVSITVLPGGKIVINGEPVWGSVKADIVVVDIAADDFAVGALYGEAPVALTADTVRLMANAAAKDRQGNIVTPQVDAEDITALNEAIAQVAATGKTAKTTVRFYYETDSGFVPEKTVSVIVRTDGTALPTAASKAYMSAQNFSWIENTELSATNARKLAFASAVDATGKAYSASNVKADESQLAVINADIERINAGEEVEDKLYDLTFGTKDGLLSVTIRVDLVNDSKKGRIGSSLFITTEKTIAHSLKDEFTTEEFITKLNPIIVDSTGVPLDLTALMEDDRIALDGWSALLGAIQQGRIGKHSLSLYIYDDDDLSERLTVKVNVLLTDEFTVVFDTNGATGGDVTIPAMENVTCGVDTLQIPAVSLYKDIGAKSYSFEGWSLTKGAGAVGYQKGENLTVDQVKALYKQAKEDESGNKSVTLYAQWKKIPGTGYIDLSITAPELAGERDMSISIYQDNLPVCDAVAEPLTNAGYTGRFEGLDGGAYQIKMTVGRKEIEETVTIEKNGSGTFAYEFNPEIIYYIDYQTMVGEQAIPAVLTDGGETTRAYIVGEAVALPTAVNAEDPVLTFIGWKDEAGKLYAAGSAPTDIYEGEEEYVHITLTSAWKEPCTVKFMDDDGETPLKDNKLVKYGTKLTLPTVEKNNYTFMGWKYNGITYAAGTLLSFGEDEEATLTAVWKEDTVKITFDPNGGSCVQAIKLLGVVTDTTCGKLPVPTNPYADFDGWYTYSGEKVEATTNAPVEDITLYAHWLGHTFDVTVNGVEQEESATYGVDYTYYGEQGEKVTITIGGKPYYAVGDEGYDYKITGDAIIGDIVITTETLAAESVVLNYWFDGKVVYTTSALKTDNYPNVTLPGKVGHNVDGWFVENDDEAAKASGEIGNGSTNLYAIATPKMIPVTFDGSGEDSVSYDTEIDFPVNPVDMTTQKFLGWKGSNGVFLPKSEDYSYTMPDVAKLDFTSVWQPVGSLSIKVVDANGIVPGAIVNLYKDGAAVKSAVTGDNGTAIFSGLACGAYNVAVVSGESNTVTTVGKDITSATNSLTVTVPTFKLNTVVEAVKAEMNITSENLEKAKTVTPEANQIVTITLTAAKVTEADSGNKEIIDAQVAEDFAQSAAMPQIVNYVELTVTKETVTVDSETGDPVGEPVVEPVTHTDDYQIISIEVTDELYQRLAEVNGTIENLLVYRLHNGTAVALTKVSEADGMKPNSGECYWIKNVEGKDYVVVKVNNFSTYALGLQSTPVEPEEIEEPVTPPAGGGGGAVTYAVTVESAVNGSVSVNKKSAAAGAAVTVTVTPAEGCKLGTLSARDAKGNAVTLTKSSDTTYTFTMPAANVTVSATFVKNGVCPQDATCVYAKFTDTNTKAWYHDGVHYCVENGMMNGVSDTQFAPNGTLTRAMVVTMLWRLENSPVVNYAMNFKDVPASKWYTEAVRWAQSVKVVEGYDANSFGPNDNVTREQLATILYRYAVLKGVDTNKFTENTNTLSHNDVFTVSDWATSGMHFCIAAGVVNGDSNGNLNPRSTATRAEAAAMFQRFCENVVK